MWRALVEAQLDEAGVVLERGGDLDEDPRPLKDARGLLGLLQQDPSAWFWQTAEDGLDTSRIEQLVEARMAAHSVQDFDTADRIREELSSLGITVQDRADGSAWQRTR